MENVEVKNEIFRDIVEMLEMYWFVGELWRINFYWFIKLKISDFIIMVVNWFEILLNWK